MKFLGEDFTGTLINFFKKRAKALLCSVQEMCTTPYISLPTETKIKTKMEVFSIEIDFWRLF